MKHVGDLEMVGFEGGEGSGKEEDGKDVITGGAGEDELRDVFRSAVFFFNEIDHAGDDNGRGRGAEDSAHYRGFHGSDGKEAGGKEKEGSELKGGREKGHENGRASYFFEVGEIDGEARFDEDDDKGHLPKVGGDGKERGGEEIKHVGPQKKSGNHHADDAREFQSVTEGGQSEAEKKYKSKG